MSRMSLAAAMAISALAAAPTYAPMPPRREPEPPPPNPNKLPAYTASMNTVRRKIEKDELYGRANWASLPKKTQRKLKNRKKR